MIKLLHKNSLEAFDALDKEKRREMITRIYVVHGTLTDREVADKLGFKDPNAVRPRITEMVLPSQFKRRQNPDFDYSIGRYPLKECGKTQDYLTGRTVRLVCLRLHTEEKQQELFGPEICNRNNLVRTLDNS